MAAAPTHAASAERRHRAARIAVRAGQWPAQHLTGTDPWYAPPAGMREWLRQQPDWGWREITPSHDAMLTSLAALTNMLLEIASGL